MLFNVEGVVYQTLKSLCAKRYWAITCIVMLNVLVVCSSFGIAYTVELLFKQEVTATTLNQFVAIILLLLLTFVASNALRQKLVFDVKEMMSTKLMSFAIGRLMYKQQQLFDQTAPSKLYSNVDYDIKAINVYVHFVLSILIQASATLLCGFIYLLVTNVYMTLVSIVAVPVVILMIFRISQKVSQANSHKRDMVSMLNAAIIESLSGIQSIKVHKMEGLLSTQIESKASDVYRATKRLHSLESIVSGLIIFGGFSSVILVLWIGGHNVISGTMASGELVAFVMVLLLMSYSFASISDINTVTAKAKSAINNLETLLQCDYELHAINTKSAEDIKHISLCDLSFSYQNNKEKALNGINYTFQRNHIYFIVGRSGSGKSTLIKLISGLYYNYQGKILLSDAEAKSQQGSPHKHVALIEQDPFFFNGTIWQNITLVDNDKKIDELRLNRALALSQFDRVIKNNQITIDSNISTNANNLSGGEKQRLAIARALYSDCGILILDEATNSLDKATESILHQHLREIARNKIVLVITHNLNSINLSDQVLVIEKGKIAAAQPPNQIITNEHFIKISEQTKSLQKEC
ncbi:ABC transporter ATP-binding protein [Pseudoalteromonas luteoviolacea]|uniref:ABC transporter ATP-binding protein n=1 Tax=Pseudoalteromonas luteoviolacea TaxID=43657 RepID=UPI001B3A3186|nr:ABC transporter ATP-binding protein [Pseudoalteromonas luteoviolacea]